MPRALSRIDTEGIIFFLGVLLSIGCLDSAGILKQLAQLLDATVPSQELIATAIGLASAVIDNVPLVAATMGMYDVAAVPQDSMLWQLIAYCAGTGGSILIIGSAAGVAFMGMESAEFLWYMRRVSPWALVGYLSGIAVYLGETSLGSGVFGVQAAQAAEVVPGSRAVGPIAAVAADAGATLATVPLIHDFALPAWHALSHIL